MPVPCLVTSTIIVAYRSVGAPIVMLTRNSPTHPKAGLRLTAVAPPLLFAVDAKDNPPIIYSLATAHSALRTSIVSGTTPLNIESIRTLFFVFFPKTVVLVLATIVLFP